MAVKRMHNLEKRFTRDTAFKQNYVEFLDEYLKLGYMKISRDAGAEQYFLPHHGVIKDSSTTTKLRVVFDGSAKTVQGTSLNNELAVGPTVQSSLVELILRFRLHKYVFTADIEKMFRQIWVNAKDAEYQKIVWRKKSHEELQFYKLVTVTYGTSSAPFLATQTLNQLAVDYQSEYPKASEILRRDFYVDDLMSGTNTREDAEMIIRDLITMMGKGGFHLRKWSSNCEQLMQIIPETDQDTSILNFDSDSQAISILGVRYSPKNYSFQFKVKLEENELTKRYMLSEASKIFDPIGWLSPTITKIKIIFQKLWWLGVDWDERLPEAIYDNYMAIGKNLIKLEDIRIHRWLYTEEEELELHGFADASELAYAAVIYSRVKGKTALRMNIVAAKTKVAPIKTVTIPRLELCAAVLLTKLMNSVLEIFKGLKVINFLLCTDSTIVLNWISSCPRKWQTFVSNSVSYILQHTNRSQWSHVPSMDNPADCSSRGLFPKELVEHSLWWNGPHWLMKAEVEWPNQDKITAEIPEEVRKEQKLNTLVSVNNENSDDWLWSLIARCSKFSKVIAVIVRMLLLFRKKGESRIAESLEFSPQYNEANKDAFNLVMRRVQLCSFASEINALTKNKHICKTSKLTSLFPFIDKVGLLRVGGRLSNADVPYAMKHPIILPARHHLTTLIVRDEHIKQLHAGPKVLMTTLKQRYHILRGKDEVRAVIRRCVKCVRLKAQQQQQLMGQLPQARVIYQRTFFTTGVDYAGPLYIKSSRLRGAKTIKAYLALFVCMATKAVHLEPRVGV